ncbi:MULTISPECIES: type II secretion system F family protein [unclassified Halomonas]|uniref:type II secretion system F family protein n=1 Tax=unclassified Halomonas TaxID=2609666 RepID=UPI0007DA25AF|nr:MULTISPECIES: type II secretion system F family protein [unclassified Halomonas]MBT2788095.1 type II secretion system F family protein [Halomonas sp. ISL-106]MBT2795844.1 type II secretion system F family protein [Halomonas sp. ISL-104]OAL61128.1 type II secretion system protein F [Halomonas sp. ALS9]
MAKTVRRRQTPAIKLARWKWIGKGPQDRPLSGEMIGRSKAEVAAELTKQNIVIRRISKKGNLGGSGRINANDVMVFARQMATMIRAGIPLLQGLQVVAESLKKPAMVALVQQMMSDISSGSSFSDALHRHPKHFDRLFVNLVSAGEQSGTLDQMLDRIATYKEKVESLKARVKKALWYPTAVMTIGISVTMLLLIKVVPEFESMFDSFGAELPALTQMTVNVSELAQRYWLAAVGALVATVLLLKISIQHSPNVAYRMHALLLRLPFIGDVMHKSAIARFSRTLATTFASGVPLVEGLDTAAGATANKVYERAVVQTRRDVATGQQLHFAMRMTNRFPPLAIQMVSIGEEAGALDDMLNRVADYYEEEVDNKVDALTSLMEPIIIVVLGVLVGGVVVSMYLPIFDLGSAL